MTKTIKDATDDELLKELQERKLARRKAAIEANRYWLELFQKVLTGDNEIIDILAPKHQERDTPFAPPSCTDSNTWNGFGTKSAGEAPGCIRCGLFEIMKGTAESNVMDNLIELEVVLKVSSP